MIPILVWKKKLLKMLAKNMAWYKLRVTLYRMCGYSIGKEVYMAEDLIITEILKDKSEKLIIEDRAAIGPRVTLLTSSDPNFSNIRPYVNCIRGKIIIKKDAWIGAGVIILPNIIIGEGAIVGAGAVVTKDVPPYTVVAGVPAKEIKKLEMRT